MEESITIDRQLLTLEDEGRKPALVAEASGLGWAPGYWPKIATVVGPHGQEVEYEKDHASRDDEGDLLAMIYTSWSGTPDLLVWND